MSRQKTRRVVLNLGKSGDLTIPDPLGLKGKNVTVTITGGVVDKAAVVSATKPKDAEVDIEINVTAVEIEEVP